MEQHYFHISSTDEGFAFFNSNRTINISGNESNPKHKYIQEYKPLAAKKYWTSEKTKPVNSMEILALGELEIINKFENIEILNKYLAEK